MTAQVITNSTSDMPEGLPEELGIRIVPIYLLSGLFDQWSLHCHSQAKIATA